MSVLPIVVLAVAAMAIFAYKVAYGFPVSRNKNFGMGKDHAVARYRAVNKGRTFYTSHGVTMQRPGSNRLLLQC